MPKARGYRIIIHTVDVEMEAFPNWKTFTKHFLFHQSLSWTECPTLKYYPY